MNRRSARTFGTYRIVKSEEKLPLKSGSREVIVVGGSAAGLYTAANVARGGRPVRVLESKPQWEPAARTLIVTDQFRSQMGSLAQESIVNEIRRFELYTDGRSAQIALKKPDLIIERSRLIAALARDAQQAGVSLSFDTRFLKLEPNGADCAWKRKVGAGKSNCMRTLLLAQMELPAAWPVHPAGHQWKRCR